MSAWTSIKWCDQHGEAACSCDDAIPLDILKNDKGEIVATIWFCEENDRHYGTVLPIGPFELGHGWKVPPARTGAIASFANCQRSVYRLLDCRSEGERK